MRDQVRAVVAGAQETIVVTTSGSSGYPKAVVLGRAALLASARATADRIGEGAWLLALPAWKPLQSQHLWIIAGVGVSGSLAQVALTEAFRRGEASLIAPLEYTALLWGVLLDVALWSVLPDGVTWIGAGIIVASGLYLLRREKVHVEAEHP